MSTSKVIKKSASNLAYRLRAIASFDFQAETLKIVQENSFYILGLLRIQLAEGKDSKGENVRVFGRDFYADKTVFEKERHGVGLGKQTEWITNYMSGRFYSQLTIVQDGKNFRIDSNVPYFEDIIVRSGRTIMELNKKHVQMFTKEVLIPTLKQRLESRQNGL